MPPIQDTPNATSHRQRMVSNLSPLVRALIEKVPRRMDEHSSLHWTEAEYLIVLWAEISFGGVSETSDSRYSLLHFHSTNCLLHWTFDLSSNNRSASPCTRQICLDDQELLHRTDAFRKDLGDFKWRMADKYDVLDLLKAVGSTGMVGVSLSHFFDNLFPLRCARILYNQLTPLCIPRDGDEHIG